MGGVAAGLAVAAVVQHQHPPLVRAGRGIATQQLQAPLVDPVEVPGGLGQEPLQPLHGPVLGAGDRLGAGQGGQGLVAIPRQQQPLQVSPEAAALGQRTQQRVEPRRVVLQRTGCGWAGQAFGHRDHLTGDVAPQPIVPTGRA